MFTIFLIKRNVFPAKFLTEKKKERACFFTIFIFLSLVNIDMNRVKTNVTVALSMCVNTYLNAVFAM